VFGGNSRKKEGELDSLKTQETCVLLPLVSVKVTDADCRSGIALTMDAISVVIVLKLLKL
jgi:hypothetical protein